MNATWLDAPPFAPRVKEPQALESRPGLSFLKTSGGRVRLRSAQASRGPRLLIATDGPNVIEHSDALLEQLEGRADVVVFEPPGTGASTPARGFPFTLDAFTTVTREVLGAVGPRTLVFPCYLGVIAQQVARAAPDLVHALALPQTPSWSDLARWAKGVDPRRVVRTPVLGQLVLAARKREVARGWYAASTGDRRFRAPFTAAAEEAFALGGCFCLASLMQGLERSRPPEPGPAPTHPTAVVWGGKDRTHRHSHPERAVPGATLVRFEDCGHSPDLEAPARFATWLLSWHEALQ